MNANTPTDDECEAATTDSIARDLLAYLRENPGVCAYGSVTGYIWLRYYDGEWQAATYGGQHRLSNYVDGQVFDEKTALSWLERNPAEPIPLSKAGSRNETTVWQATDEQDVFADVDRCFWCGESERSTGLATEATHDHGEIDLCADCRASWADAGELVDDREEATV